MAINTNAESPQIAQRNYKNTAADQENDRLIQFLKGIQTMSATVGDGMNKQANEKLKAQLQGQAQDASIEKNKKLAGEFPTAATGVTAEGSHITPKDNTQRQIANDDRNERFKDTQANKLADHYGKLAGFNSALMDLENLTNSDKKGGVLTNPNASLRSTGRVLSKVPDAVVGAGEAMGFPGIEKGAAEERKALGRLQLEYQKAMTGQRTSEEMSKREQAAIGFLASDDPNLVSKGVRALAGNVGRQFQNIQAGFKPDVVSAVNGRGEDPLSFYKKVYQDPALPPMQSQSAGALANASPPPGGAQAPQQQAAAPKVTDALTSFFGGGKPASASPAQAPGGKTLLKQQVNPTTGQKRNVYSDGSVEVVQ